MSNALLVGTYSLADWANDDNDREYTDELPLMLSSPLKEANGKSGLWPPAQIVGIGNIVLRGPWRLMKLIFPVSERLLSSDKGCKGAIQ